jgi:hypothetical protein
MNIQAASAKAKKMSAIGSKNGSTILFAML